LQILDRDEKVISASLFCSQPWLDVPDNNLSLIIYTKERDTGYYSEYAQRILDSIWEKRQEFLVDFPDIKTVLANIGQYPKPVILIDSGDITTAGCPGDSTEILRALLDFSSPWKTIIPLVDPETVQRAVAVGKGNEGEFFPGGSPNGGYNLRTPVKARVLSLSDTPIRIKGQSLAGLKLDMGCRVCLKMNEAIHLIVTEYSSWAHDPEFIRSMLLKPEDFDILVQKSHKLFRAAYANIARSVIAVGTSGCSSPRLDQFVFTKVKRPVFPLDPFEE